MTRALQYLTAALVMLSVDARAADKAPLDGELVYRNNCTRCHIAIHTFPGPMLATVTRHMRVRATLTVAETEAVLKYLAESSPAPHAASKLSKPNQGATNK